MSRILRTLSGGAFTEFSHLFQPEHGVPVLVVSFLALLELARDPKRRKRGLPRGTTKYLEILRFAFWKARKNWVLRVFPVSLHSAFFLSLW